MRFTIYSPNFDCPQLFHDLVSLARQLPDLPLIWGGDFNCVLDPDLDCSGGPLRLCSAAAKAIIASMTELRLLDIWRTRAPRLGGFIHYSAPYNLHTRIDYWLEADTLGPSVRDCEILPNTYSDHSPIMLTLAPPAKRPTPFTWRSP